MKINNFDMRLVNLILILFVSISIYFLSSKLENRTNYLYNESGFIMSQLSDSNIRISSIEQEDRTPKVIYQPYIKGG